MTITRNIVCLANSRKTSGRCIAGKEVHDQQILNWIRPVSSRQTEEISEEERRFRDGQMPSLLDILRIPILAEKPSFFQTENVLIDDKYYWQKVNVFEKRNLINIIDKPDSLWENDNSSYYGQNDRVANTNLVGKSGSLFLITPSSLEIVVKEEGREFGGGKRRVRADFLYKKVKYLWTVTDPAIEERYLAMDDGIYIINNPENRVYLCVSLGLPYEDNNCYKFLASIIET